MKYEIKLVTLTQVPWNFGKPNFENLWFVQHTNSIPSVDMVQLCLAKETFTFNLVNCLMETKIAL